MSFFSRGEKVFDIQNPQYNNCSPPEIKRSDHRLKSFYSNSDKRAWHFCEGVRYRHFYELISKSQSCLDTPKCHQYVPLEDLIKLFTDERDVKIKELELELKKCCSNNKARSQEPNTSGDAAQELFRSRETLRQAMHKLQNIDEIINENKRLHCRLRCSEERIKYLEEKKKRLESELADARSKSQVQMELKRAQEMLSRVTQQENGTEMKGDEVNLEREKLLEKINNLEKELEESKKKESEIELLKKQFKSDSMSMEEISKENECYRKKLASMKCLEKQIQEIKKQGFALAEKYKKESQKAAEQMKKMCNVTKEVQILREEKERLQKRMEEMASHESQFKALQCKLKRVEAVIAENELLNNKLIALDKLEKENEYLRCRLDQIQEMEMSAIEDKERIVQLQCAVADQEEEMKDLLCQIERLTSGRAEEELERLKCELLETNSKLKLCEEQLAEIPMLEAEIDDLRERLRRCCREFEEKKASKHKFQRIEVRYPSKLVGIHAKYKNEKQKESSVSGFKEEEEKVNYDQNQLSECHDTFSKDEKNLKSSAASDPSSENKAMSCEEVQSLLQSSKGIISCVLEDMIEHNKEMEELEMCNRNMKNEIEILKAKVESSETKDMRCEIEKLNKLIKEKDLEINELKISCKNTTDIEDLKNLNDELQNELKAASTKLKQVANLEKLLILERQARCKAEKLLRDKNRGTSSRGGIAEEDPEFDCCRTLQLEIYDLKLQISELNKLTDELKKENNLLRELQQPCPDFSKELDEKCALENLLSLLQAELDAFKGQRLSDECEALRNELKRVLEQNCQLKNLVNCYRQRLSLEKKEYALGEKIGGRVTLGKEREKGLAEFGSKEGIASEVDKDVSLLQKKKPGEALYDTEASVPPSSIHPTAEFPGSEGISTSGLPSGGPPGSAGISTAWPPTGGPPGSEGISAAWPPTGGPPGSEGKPTSGLPSGGPPGSEGISTAWPPTGGPLDSEGKPTSGLPSGGPPGSEGVSTAWPPSGGPSGYQGVPTSGPPGGPLDSEGKPISGLPSGGPPGSQGMPTSGPPGGPLDSEGKPTSGLPSGGPPGSEGISAWPPGSQGVPTSETPGSEGISKGIPPTGGLLGSQGIPTSGPGSGGPPGSEGISTSGLPSGGLPGSQGISTSGPASGGAPGPGGILTSWPPGSQGMPMSGPPGSQGMPTSGPPGSQGMPTSGPPGSQGMPTSGPPGSQGMPTTGPGSGGPPGSEGISTSGLPSGGLPGSQGMPTSQPLTPSQEKDLVSELDRLRKLLDEKEKQLKDQETRCDEMIKARDDNLKKVQADLVKLGEENKMLYGTSAEAKTKPVGSESDECEKRLRELEKENEEKMRKLLDQHQKEMTNREKAYNDNLNAMKAGYETDIRKMAERHKASIMRLQALHEDEVKELNTNHETQMETMQTQSEMAMKDIARGSAIKMRKLAQQHEKDLKNAEDEINKLQGTLRKSLEEMENLRRDDGSDKVAELMDKHNREIQKMKKSSMRRLSIVTSKYEGLLEDEKKRSEAQLDTLKRRLKEKAEREGGDGVCECKFSKRKSSRLKDPTCPLDFAEVLEKILERGLESLSFNEIALVHRKSCCALKEIVLKSNVTSLLEPPVGEGCPDVPLLQAEKEQLLQRIAILENEINLKQRVTEDAILDMEVTIKKERCRLEELRGVLESEQKKNNQLKLLLTSQTQLQSDLRKERDRLGNQAAIQESLCIEKTKELKQEKENNKYLEEELENLRTTVRKLCDLLKAERRNSKAHFMGREGYECAQMIQSKLEEANNRERRLALQLEKETKCRKELQCQLQTLKQSFQKMVDLTPTQKSDVPQETKSVKEKKNMDQIKEKKSKVKTVVVAAAAVGSSATGKKHKK